MARRHRPLLADVAVGQIDKRVRGEHLFVLSNLAYLAVIALGGVGRVYHPSDFLGILEELRQLLPVLTPRSDDTDDLCRQAGVELVLKIPADIVRTRAKGIHADNLVSHVLGKYRLALTHRLSGKASVTVAGSVNPHFAMLSLNGLGHPAIATVAGLTGFITEVSIHLTLQSGIQYPLQHRDQGIVLPKQGLPAAQLLGSQLLRLTSYNKRVILLL